MLLGDYALAGRRVVLRKRLPVDPRVGERSLLQIIPRIRPAPNGDRHSQQRLDAVKLIIQLIDAPFLRVQVQIGVV